MAGSVFGNILRISTWGESHGAAVGVVVDGCPAGLTLCEEDVQQFLDLRRPGQSLFTTPRREADAVRIMSGVFEGRTTGAPISMMVMNTSQRPADYSAIAACYRPGHADYTFDAKYGFRDYRGGGRSSGRETIGRVAGGAVALRLLQEMGISVTAYTKSIGPVSISPEKSDDDEIYRNAFYMPDADAAARAEELIKEMMKEQDSIGGVIECRADGVPAGLGDPVFEKISANLAKAVCSVGAVKGFEIGDGFGAALHRGSENNDPFIPDDSAAAGRPGIKKASNHAGGVLGGISDGSRICFRAAVKPTPSISRTQRTVTKDGVETDINIRGRHDPVIMPRAVVVIRSMAALVIADALLMNMTAKMDYLRAVYQKLPR